MWFIGVEVEQETSAPPPKKNPRSAPGFYSGHSPRRKITCASIPLVRPRRRLGLSCGALKNLACVEKKWPHLRWDSSTVPRQDQTVEQSTLIHGENFIWDVLVVLTRNF